MNEFFANIFPRAYFRPYKSNDCINKLTKISLVPLEISAVLEYYKNYT